MSKNRTYFPAISANRPPANRVDLFNYISVAPIIQVRSYVVRSPSAQVAWVLRTFLARGLSSGKTHIKGIELLFGVFQHYQSKVHSEPVAT